MRASFHIPFWPLSFLYGTLIRARNFSYARGLSTVHKISKPVISVGNITTGGTGKTPLVEYLARALARQHLTPCILTRGYGRLTSASTRVLVSDARQILADADEGGDEPFLLAENLLGIAAVISDADRVAAARWAIEHLPVDCFILDDGFQHRRLHRDLDLVVIDATAPWSNRQLLPSGRLREPLSSLKRADALILTRTELVDDPDLIINELKNHTRPQTPILSARTFSTALKSLVSENNLVVSSPRKYLAFCGVGNPDSFFRRLKQEGYQLLLTRAYPDHHRYSQAEVDSLINQAQRLGANALITTAKDAVKLRRFSFSLPCDALSIEITFEGKDQLILEGLLKRVIQASHI